MSGTQKVGLQGPAKQHGRARAAVGKLRLGASAGMGLWGVHGPDERLCPHVFIPEFLTTL